ncbi:MAG: hypothetical protein ACRC1U_11395, partial [Vibrionaceae bacterium]
HKLRAIEEEMVETIEFFQSLASAPQQEVESKAASEDNAASGDTIKNAKTQSDRAADHKAASQETAQQDETQEEEGSNGAFFFGGAEAMPTRRVKDDDEAEKYKYEYEQWAEDEAEKAEQLRRQKRRANEDVDPVHYLTLDYAAANPNAQPVDLSKVKQALADYVSTVQAESVYNFPDTDKLTEKLLDFEYALTLARNDPDVDTFISDAADLYAIRMFDTDPNVRLGYAYFQQRVREAAMQGLTYYDTGLEEFYGYTIRSYHDDPVAGSYYRASSLIAKTLAAVEMQEPLDGFRYGMAMGEVAMYSQMVIYQDSQKLNNAILARQDQVQYDPKAVKLVQRLNRDLGLVPDADGGFSKKHRFKAHLFSQTQISIDGAPLANTNVGLCSLMANSIAYELKAAQTESTSTRTADGTNVHTLKQIFERMSDLDDYLASDPALAYRFMQGSTYLNDQLQISHYHELTPHRRQLNSFDDLPKIMSRITKDDPLVISLGRHSKNAGGHAISIAPIITQDSKGNKITTYVVVDANFGVIPCATLDQAVDILKISGASFLGEDVSNPNLNDLKMVFYPVNDAVAAVMKDPPNSGVKETSIARPDGNIDVHRYGDMFGEDGLHWSHWAKNNDVSESPNWSKLLPAELAKKTVEMGDYNTPTGLKERFGTGPDDVLIPKSSEIIEALINIGANKQAGCLVGSCTVDFDKYYDGDDSPFAPPKTAAAGAGSTSTTALLGQQLSADPNAPQAGGPGTPIYSNAPPNGAAAAGGDDPDYMNVKRHKPLKRKTPVKKRQVRAKITVDEMYETAKPVLGMDLPDDVYANIAKKALENKLSIADGDVDVFKHVAAAAGQSLTDEDIWGVVGLKLKKNPPPKVDAGDDSDNIFWKKISERRKQGRYKGKNTGKQLTRELLKGDSIAINPEELMTRLQEMRSSAEDEISAIGKAMAHQPDTQDNEYVAAVLGRKDPRLEPEQDLPWMSKVTDNIESSSDLSAVKVRGISAEDSLSSSKALYSAGNVLETAAAAEEFLAGKTVLQAENIDEGGGISRSGLADTTIESSPEKIIVKKDGAAAIEIEVDEANSGLSKKERFKRATQKLQAKKAEINAAEAAEAELSAKSVGQSAIGANAEQDLSAFANKATQLDEPEVLRAMYIYGEELQLENQRMLALSQQVETEVTDFLRKQGEVPADWKLMPPRGDTEIEDFTFSYRGTDTELQGQTKTVKLTDKLADRWRRLSAEVQEISTRISDSQFSVKLQSFVSSKAYHRAGKALGLASKAMNLYSLYNLAFESQNIRNLRPHYQVSFVLGAMDTVLDAVSNTLNLSNKLFKMAH